MKKKLLILITSIFPILTYADYSGTFGDNITYSFDKSTMTLTLSGTGKMTEDVRPYNLPWYKYKEAIHTVIIEEGITSICSEAFELCDNLDSVSIAKSVSKIGNSAFHGCSKLKTITLPENLTKIGDLAFFTSGLTSIIIPDNVTSIGTSAFAYTNLQSIIIGNKIKVLNRNIFTGCRGLSSVILGNNITTICFEAFYQCTKLTSISLPKSIKSIEMCAFQTTGLIDVYCYAEEIPETGLDVFANVKISNATLHVLSSEINMYKVIDPWKEFGNIVALTDEETAIMPIKAESNDDEKVYTLWGNQTNKVHKGINFVKTKDGRTKKVIIKR